MRPCRVWAFSLWQGEPPGGEPQPAELQRVAAAGAADAGGGRRCRNRRGERRRGARNEDVGPAIVARVVGQANGALLRSADFPEVDLVVGDVVVVPALGDTPHQPFTVCRKLRKIFVRATAGEVDQVQLVVVVGLLGGAVLERHAENLAASVAGRVYPIDAAPVRRPVDLATEPGLAPSLLVDIPNASFALRSAQGDGDELAVTRQLGLLQQRPVQIGDFGAVDERRLFARRQLSAKNQRVAHEHDLVGARPARPAAVVDDLRHVGAVGLHGVDVPLAALVGVALAYPAALATAKQNLGAVGREAWKPIHRVSAGDLLHVAAVGVHGEEIVVADPRARPDDGPLNFFPDRRHGGCFFATGSVF